MQLVDVEFYSAACAGPTRVLTKPCVGSSGYHDEQITASIDPVEVALGEIERLPVGAVAKTLSRIATRGRR